jgi:hypothetical protein
MIRPLQLKSKTMVQYKNTFYNQTVNDSKPVIQTEVTPKEYKGYLIYERIKGVCFDIVKDGACIGMYAGVNGAKGFIDTL